jgi:hypothetical protein
VLAAAHGVIESIPYEPAPGMHPATFISFDADGFASARVLVRILTTWMVQCRHCCCWQPRELPVPHLV